MKFQFFKSFWNRISQKPRRTLGILSIATLFFILLFMLLDSLFPFKPNVDYSTLILDNKGKILNAYLSKEDKWRLYLNEDEITEDLQKAILFKEDKYFYYHPGVNPLSIVRALFQNSTSGVRKSGASTITMQLARLLNPKERTYANKLLEMFHALQLEYHYSKKEILRLYLNLLPYGGNIEGVKSASHIYFGKDPKLLSLAELTGIVVIPNRPSSLSINNDHGPINQAKDEWLRRFEAYGIFQKHIIELARSEEIKPSRRNLPRNAPHLSRRLKNQVNEFAIETFIDLEKQKKIEALAKSHIDRLRYLNVTNTAIVVVENETGKVICYVGSSDFHSQIDGGQVDGVKAIRSPGSTLKPLLYALHFDQGTLSPKTRIADVQMNFGGYEPVNYDNTYHGWVSSEEALKQSLNVPAVKLLNDFGVKAFAEVLSKTDFKTIEKSKDAVGLSMILGGCGTSLEEITGLYSAFANKGVHRPFQYYDRKSQDSLNERTVLSEQAAFILTEILTEVVRPDLPDSWKNNPNRPKIAWKTGTSFGRRDAWSIGYNKEYTIGVWAGNFSGEGAPELSGVAVAAPLLFDVFNVVSDVSAHDWYVRPRGVLRNWVCNETGLRPNSFCKNLVVDQTVKGVESPRVCQHLRSVMVSLDSTESYCATCIKDIDEYIEILYPNYTAEMLSYFQSAEISITKIPDHYQFCERVYPDRGLRIVSPVDKLMYYIDQNDEKQIQLQVQAPSNASKFFWYINDEFYQSAAREEVLYFTPPDGRVKISCSDDRGRNQDISISIKRVHF